MANWAYTAYVIEGPKDTLNKIYSAIKTHTVREGSDEWWEGNILDALDSSWEDLKDEGEALYMRGFIEDFNLEDNTLHINATEAYGLTHFHVALEHIFKDIKVYWIVEGNEDEIYCTNDKEGKYFSERYYVDVSIDGKDEIEYFSTREEVYKWLSTFSDGEIKSKEDAEAYNRKHEDLGDEYDNYVHIYEYTVV